MNPKTAAVAALLSTGYGTSRAAGLVKTFPSFETWLEASPSDYDKSVFTAQDIKSLTAHDIDKADRLRRLCEERGYGMVCYYDKEYPSLLRNISDPPLILFTRGKPLPDMDNCPTVSIVGTRDAKRQYIKFAAVNSFSLSVLGYTVVSGFANGIDTYALKGALYAGGGVISVFPCGVDVLPGKADPELLSVLCRYGTAVSEYLPGTPLKLWQYARRNRIISGLTQSTLVVEAGIESGALSTAEYAFTQGRVVYAVPDEPYEPRSEGGNYLLRNGAVIASSFIDIVDDYNKKYGYNIDISAHREELKKGFGAAPSIVVTNELVEEYLEGNVKTPHRKASRRKAPEPSSPAPAETLPHSPSPEKETADKPDYPLLAAEDILVLKLLEKQPASLDGVCSALSMSFSSAIDELSRLTDLGYAEEVAGGLYRVTGKRS